MIKKENDLLGSLLHDVAHLIRLEIDSRLERHNLTRVKWLALGIIQKNKGLTQAQLASDLELGSAAVGRLVERLVERGFIERKPAPKDKRAYQLFLRPGVKKILLELEQTGESIRAKALDDVTKDEIAMVSEVLQKIKKNLACMFILLQSTVIEFETTIFVPFI